MAACQSIPDKFNNIYEVKNALNNAGLESANSIIGIDFTKSNEWTGGSLMQARGIIGETYIGLWRRQIDANNRPRW
ncbi:hypothetical protein KP509_06G023800 [Ceratopteris richardii]|uniref:Uncharacterized protein n=1 Tax=Ceratopteris richardii TaxID=49495 RepID=A0A8T2UM38_CERRI|nr:hypothetical protein KP509_06G023800 [Ceratopteris richardii]